MKHKNTVLVLLLILIIFITGCVQQKPIVVGGPCSYVTLKGECKITSVYDKNLELTEDAMHYYNAGTILAINYTFIQTEPMISDIELGEEEKEEIIEQVTSREYSHYARDFGLFLGLRCLVKPGIGSDDFFYKNVKEKCRLTEDNVFDCDFVKITRQDLEKCNLTEGTVLDCQLRRIIRGTCGPGGFEFYTNESLIKEKIPQDYCRKKVSFIGSDNPQDFLEKLKLPYLPASSEQEYQIIQSKVNEIISGLKSDREKTEAIAKWVSGSKKYSGGMIKHGKYMPSIFEIYNMENGSCNEASLLTAEMLRMAGIPARVVVPQLGTWHGYAEAYFDGKWRGIDSTFGRVKFDFEITSPITFFQFREHVEKIPDLFVNSYFEPYFNLDCYNYAGKYHSGWGSVTYALGRRDYDADTMDVSVSALFVRLNDDIKCNNYFCEKTTNKAEARKIWKTISFTSCLGYTKDDEIEGPIAGFYSGVITHQLPPGNYILGYVDGGSSELTAYTDEFEIKKTENVNITPDMLKSPETYQGPQELNKKYQGDWDDPRPKVYPFDEFKKRIEFEWNCILNKTH